MYHREKNHRSHHPLLALGMAIADMRAQYVAGTLNIESIRITRM